MRGAIQGLVAASLVLAISVQYQADAALNANLQLPPARIDPLGLTLLKPDLSGPAATARFYPYGEVFAAVPRQPDAALKLVVPDAPGVSAVTSAPAAAP